MRVRCPSCAHSFDHTEGRTSKIAARPRAKLSGSSKLRSKPSGASKLPARPKRPKLRSGGVPEDPKFLAFVRTHRCLACDNPLSEPHHWGRRGAGQKCSDYETVPLCHECHVGKLHGEGELLGMTAREWRPRFRKWSSGAVTRYLWLGNVLKKASSPTIPHS